MRLFIAITLSDEAINHLRYVQDRIRQVPARISFVREFHLTLKFLGEESDPDKVMQALDKIRFRPLKFSLSQIGFFPDKKRPRVIWVGIEPKLEIIALQQQIDRCLEEAGFPKDRVFHPHITLGRVKHVEKDAFAALADALVTPISIGVESFSLVKSELNPEGPAYTVLKEYKL